MKRVLPLILLTLVCCSTSDKQTTSDLYREVSTLSMLEGKPEFLASPMVTAGDRVYMIGFQDGSFPDLGWHVTGEMGGVWDHPIKLLDGFAASLRAEGGQEVFCLDKADKFANYPMANRHHFIWEKENLEVDRTQFVPDGVEGVMIEFRISNHGKEKKELQFAFTGMTDLRPTWLGERTEMTDAEDEVSYNEEQSAVMAKDKNNPWYTAFGSSFKGNFSEDGADCQPQARKGLGKNATLRYPVVLEAGEEIAIPFFIAGSYKSENELFSTYEILKEQGREKFLQKSERYKKIQSTSRLTIPDKNIEQMYEWLKYNTDWLVRKVPEQGVGICAGLPDYPWWFGGDTAYSLQGVLATGDHELAKNSILLLHKISQQTNGNGRIIHEVSTNGSVYNKGNVNETAQFISLVNTYYEWTGDKELVTQLFPDIKKGMTWLLTERDPDGNHYPNGSGMMEIPGLESNLEMIDVAAYTQQALVSGAALARALGEKSVAEEYEKLAEELRAKINAQWWQPDESSFGDFRGTVAEATPILNAALIRSDTLGRKWAVQELKNTQMRMKKYPVGQTIPHVIYHNWVVNTPLETGIADRGKGIAALMNSKTYENPFGVYVTGIDKTEESDSVILKSRKKTFSYTGAVMTISTGVQAVAAARYAGSDEALKYINKLHQSFSYALPGSMYEVSPDFGMITQAWNIYGVAVPIVHYFFGIKPQAYEKTVYFSPQLPSTWKDASLENVRVGDNSISVYVSRKEEYVEYRIQQTLPDWAINFTIEKAAKVMVNDKVVDVKTLADKRITLSGGENVVRVY